MGPMTVSGNVVEIHSHWTQADDRIVTDATIQQPDGSVVVVQQLGGNADGLGQVVFDGEPLLKPGMTVDVTAHVDVDLSNHSHIVTDSVAIRAYPAASLDPVTGFVRTGPTDAGNYLYWESGCIHLTPDSDGTKEIAGDQEFPIIDSCIATWNDDTVDCSYLKVVNDGSASVEVNGKDYTNVLKFRDASWCRPATTDAPAKCYSDSSAGITTATFVNDGGKRDGAIVDADIEINGVNFSIAASGVTLGINGCQAELANTLTHELGHLHGLEHTCLATGDPSRIDNNGNPVPDCSATTDPAITEATMYPFQDCGETKKETLEPDDINAICTIYPTAKDPHSCAAVDAGTGCCSSSGGSGSVVLAGLVGLLLLRKTRRPR
jgi:hypothetical protein